MGYTQFPDGEPGIEQFPGHLLHDPISARKRKLAQRRRMPSSKAAAHGSEKSYFRICLSVDDTGKLQTDISSGIDAKDRARLLADLLPIYRDYLRKQGLPIAGFADLEYDAPKARHRDGTDETNLVLRPASTDHADVAIESTERFHKRPRSNPEDKQVLDISQQKRQLEDTRASAQSFGRLNDLQGIQVQDSEKLEEYLSDAFTAFQQINCRTLCKSWIRTIEPKKQVNFPYNGNLKIRGNPKVDSDEQLAPKDLDPEDTKPKWWPPKDVCPHKEPDHIRKEHRLGLLCHLLMNKDNTHHCSTEDLQQAIETEKAKVKPPEKIEILTDVWKIGRALTRFKNGEIDGTSEVYVTSWKEEAQTVKSGGRSRKTTDQQKEESDDDENEDAESEILETLPDTEEMLSKTDPFIKASWRKPGPRGQDAQLQDNHSYSKADCEGSQVAPQLTCGPIFAESMFSQNAYCDPEILDEGRIDSTTGQQFFGSRDGPSIPDWFQHQYMAEPDQFLLTSNQASETAGIPSYLDLHASQKPYLDDVYQYNQIRSSPRPSLYENLQGMHGTENSSLTACQDQDFLLSIPYSFDPTMCRQTHERGKLISSYST